jgi:hypothetical protein
MIDDLEQLVRKAQPQLYEWMQTENIRYTNFSFRWMNCLLVREFTLPLLFRVWDLFVSNHSKIPATQVYVCAAMLDVLGPSLVNLPESDFVMRIQSLSPEFWSLENMETVLAQAFVYEKNPKFLRT